MSKVPRVGIGVIIKMGRKVLLLKRKGAHGEGTWAFFGGHLKFNESLEEGAKREVEEETGVLIKNIRAATFTNDIFPKEKKHYITLFVIADFAGGTLPIKETQYVEKLEWFMWGKFPKPLFTPVANLIKKGFNPFKV